MNKRKLGKEVLNQISLNVHLDCIELNDAKQPITTKEININKHEKAKKFKEDIKKHFKDLISNCNILDQKGSDSLDEIGSISNSNSNICDNEVCSICSINKKNEIFAYPLYIYRTKFPFIIDKPPMLEKDEVVDENLGDIDIDIEEYEEVEEEEEEEEDENEKSALM